jgi:hypothetical protein
MFDSIYVLHREDKRRVFLAYNDVQWLDERLNDNLSERLVGYHYLTTSRLAQIGMSSTIVAFNTEGGLIISIGEDEL